MFLDRTFSKDKVMVESWKGDADGMLVFVGLQIASHTFAYNAEPVDRCILCHGRGIARSIRPDYCAKPAGHVKFLSRTNLSATFYPTEWIPTFHPVELF